MFRTFLLLVSARLMLVVQAVTSSIVGSATDAGGTAVPAALIKVTNVDTDAFREVVTDERGDYVVPPLQPGNYRTEGSLPAFQSLIALGVCLEMDRTVRVEIRLEFGPVTQQVTVEARGGFIKNESADVGQVIAVKQVVDLPLNGRDFLHLAKITTGVTPSMSTRGSSEANSFSGARSDLTMHVGGRGDIGSFL